MKANEWISRKQKSDQDREERERLLEIKQRRHAERYEQTKRREEVEHFDAFVVELRSLIDNISSAEDTETRDLSDYTQSERDRHFSYLRHEKRLIELDISPTTPHYRLRLYPRGCADSICRC